ncbi:hypothetical protein EDB87DRAFT_1579496 [Lactarius vividus]|nr:hypothetical protein EDB87DRAFT_1579496 [Lactarius vividus]
MTFEPTTNESTFAESNGGERILLPFPLNPNTEDTVAPHLKANDKTAPHGRDISPFGMNSDTKGRIVFESEHEAGGHFAAYEQPEALVGDLRKMFGKSGPAGGVVSGCTDY